MPGEKMSRGGMQVHHQVPELQDLTYQALPGSQLTVAVREESSFFKTGYLALKDKMF